MIEIDGLRLQFSYMGYFVGEKDWIHPCFTLDTYEIIFVTGGTVYIREGDTDYTLNKGDAIILRPGVMHKGFKRSDDTSFFWLHFYSNNFEGFTENLFHANDYYNYELLFRRLNHLNTIGANKSLIECELALMLLNRKYPTERNNKLFFEIADYIKVHIASGLSVTSVAQKFGYNPDYLSKIFIKNTGLSLKKYIDRERNGFVKSLLVNTNLTIKEIAENAGFDDDGAFIKFFRYNNNQTPTDFRSQNYATHTNNK